MSGDGAVARDQNSPSPPMGNGPLVTFGLAQFAAFTGLWVQKAAVGWLIWELTHSPAWVGAVALSDLIAAICVGPFSGAMADRTSAFRLIVVTQSIILVNTAVLWAFVVSGSITPVLLIAWVVFDACVQTLNQPVRLVVIGALAPAGRTGQAIAGNSVAVNMARVIGPAIGGLLMLSAGVSYAFVLSFCLFTTMIVAVLVLRGLLGRPKLIAATRPSLLGDIKAGINYVRRDSRIALLFVVALAFSLLARPFAELFPALAGGSFGGGPDTLAWFMSAQGIGALFGAMWLLKPRSPNTILAITGLSLVGIGITLVVFSFLSDITLALIAIAIAGMFHVLCNIGMQTNSQTLSTEAMRGRVVGFYWLVFRAAPAIGAFALGLLAEWLDLQVLIGVAAGLFLVVVFALAGPARRTFRF